MDSTDPGSMNAEIDPRGPLLTHGDPALEIGDPNIGALASTQRSASSRTGWIAAAVTACAALVVVVAMWMWTATLRAEVDSLRENLSQAVARESVANSQLDELRDENTRLHAATESLSRQVETQEGESAQIKKRQDEIDANLRREQADKTSKKKKRKRRRR